MNFTASLSCLCNRGYEVSINVQLPDDADADFLVTIHQCPEPLCRRFYILVMKAFNEETSVLFELDYTIMSEGSGEEKSKHFSDSFMRMMTNDVKLYLEMFHDSCLAIGGIERYLGSLLSAYEIQEYVEGLPSPESDVTPMTEAEIAEMTNDFQCLERGGKLPWET